jgi:hypothetical protein
MKTAFAALAIGHCFDLANAAVNQKSVNGKPALYYRCHINYRMASGFLLFSGGGVDTFIAGLCNNSSFDEGDSRQGSGLKKRSVNCN